MKRIYCVIMIQLIVWSAYTTFEWLSKNDHHLYNLLMFGIFMYLAFGIGNVYLRSAKKTFITTLGSLVIYFTLQLLLNIFIVID